MEVALIIVLLAVLTSCGYYIKTLQDELDRPWWQRDRLMLPHRVIAFEDPDVHIVYEPIRKSIVVFRSQSNRYLMEMIGEVCWKIELPNNRQI